MRLFSTFGSSNFKEKFKSCEQQLKPHKRTLEKNSLILTDQLRNLYQEHSFQPASSKFLDDFQPIKHVLTNLTFIAGFLTFFGFGAGDGKIFTGEKLIRALWKAAAWSKTKVRIDFFMFFSRVLTNLQKFKFINCCANTSLNKNKKFSSIVDYLYMVQKDKSFPKWRTESYCYENKQHKKVGLTQNFLIFHPPKRQKLTFAQAINPI
ncbi:hypothetical protein C2G38_2152396 [Gigaspora rosea]|uniref:Uncharacterized protein n=1 Tax=Gigaspora rosea TaxID=44941 RepID=A0A397W9V2_9GLOM|nr:hypothetical protein C2G38_2152396 [Gigaspora rosea]